MALRRGKAERGGARHGVKVGDDSPLVPFRAGLGWRWTRPSWAKPVHRERKGRAQPFRNKRKPSQKKKRKAEKKKEIKIYTNIF